MCIVECFHINTDLVEAAKRSTTREDSSDSHKYSWAVVQQIIGVCAHHSNGNIFHPIFVISRFLLSMEGVFKGGARQ